MKDWQERVVEEREQLNKKIENLKRFMNACEFCQLSAAEQVRLHRQVDYMTLYSVILRKRIDAFKVEGKTVAE